MDKYNQDASAYYKRKDKEVGAYLNYDLEPLIKDFSFTEFLNPKVKTNHGAILVITNHQYILGYTDGFGVGTHRVAMARIMKDITGGGRIATLQEAQRLEKTCKDNFLVARIVYDYRGLDTFLRPQYGGAMYISLPKSNTITEGQFEQFMKFYEEHHEELARQIKRYGMGKFNIQYKRIDSEGVSIFEKTDTLEPVKIYLESRINHNQPIDEIDEVILNSQKDVRKRILKK